MAAPINTAAEVPSPPIARKVIVGALGYAAALVIQAVVPGYHPSEIVEQIINGVVGTGASFLVKEEIRYLVPALKKAEQYENGIH